MKSILEELGLDPDDHAFKSCDILLGGKFTKLVEGVKELEEELHKCRTLLWVQSAVPGAITDVGLLAVQDQLSPEKWIFAPKGEAA